MSKRTIRYARVVVCAALVGVAGCTSTPGATDASSSVGSASATASSGVGTTPVAASPSIGSTPRAVTSPRVGSTATGTPPSTVAPCAPGQLALSAAAVSPGATHRGVRITVGLANGPACELSGYPEIEADEGGPMIRADHTLRGYLGGLPPDRDTPPVVIVTDSSTTATGAASAIVEGMAVDANGNPCPTYTHLSVTPPNSPTPQPVPATINACALEVHPVLGADMH
ncbi:DUF4232 domain-containing protein [Nocardia sp. NBC_01499]|uniref:DUF4232 domain-containing protein n=1 Tax=Nocardia sp. NBC_01499 TaxID=2903597 RepID=UPI00386BFA27